MELKIVYYILVTVYAALMLLAGSMQFKNKSYSKISPFIMVFGSLLLFLSVAQMYIGSTYTVLILVIGLVLIHISAIMNGFNMHGKLTYKHHIVRFLLSVVLVSIAIV